MAEQVYKARFEGGIWNGRESLIDAPQPMLVARQSRGADTTHPGTMEQVYQMGEISPEGGMTIVTYRPAGPPVER